MCKYLGYSSDEVYRAASKDPSIEFLYDKLRSWLLRDTFTEIAKETSKANERLPLPRLKSCQSVAKLVILAPYITKNAVSVV